MKSGVSDALRLGVTVRLRHQRRRRQRPAPAQVRRGSTSRKPRCTASHSGRAAHARAHPGTCFAREPRFRCDTFTRPIYRC